MKIVILVAALSCAACERAGAAPPDRRAPDGGAGAATTVDPAAIASGKPLWVDSDTNPEFALLDARVDIGTITRVGDELEVAMRWPIGPGRRRDLAFTDPSLRVPDGAVELDRERIRCGRDRLQFFAIETAIVGPGGEVLRRTRHDPAAARRQEEETAARMPGSSSPFAKYGRSPRDLVCWAVARKCEGKPFRWPPPPNDTRFDDPDYARKRDAHDAQFIPSCKLK